MTVQTMPVSNPNSEKLTKAELKALKEYRKKFNTEVGCAISLGLDRTVLNNTITRGSGRPDTIEKIRKVLSAIE